MSTENESVSTEQTNEPQPESNPIEAQAREMGWLPKEEYAKDSDKDVSKWVSADIFVARAPLFEKIEDQNKRLKSYEKTLNDLKKFQASIAEREYKRALDDLKARKKEALSDHDLVAADEINEEILNLSKQAPAATPAVPPEFTEWSERNAWYNEDEDLRDFADAKGNKLAAAGGLSSSEILAKVEEAVKRAFPDKFKKSNPNRAKAPSVESESATAPLSSSDKGFRLTEDEERVARNFERNKVMTRAEYIAEIKKSRG